MKRFLQISIITLSVLIALGAAGLAGLYFWAARDLPGFQKVTDYRPPLVTTVYADGGEVLGYFYKEKRFLVRLSQVSPWVGKAFLAAEDDSFYQHEGVDFAGIFRAMIKNIKAGSIKQGGSTITQQVIKRLLLTPEKSYKRKLKEAILAYRLERYLTKEEILTIYLNQIYLGAGAYGIEAASRIYFGKHAKDLDLAQAALLAGLPQAPSRYSPNRHPETAKNRQRYVLDRMLELGWITKSQFEEALAEPLVYTSMDDPSWQKGPYYLEEVRRLLVERYGEDMVYNGGLNVYTGCDLKHQDAADVALKKGLIASTKRRGWRGPVQELAPHEWPKFLQENPLEVQSLLDGQWTKVLVESVKPDGARIRTGNYTAYMPVSTMKWCRELDPSKSWEDVKSVKDATTILKTGDVVFAEFMNATTVKGDPVDIPANATAGQLAGLRLNFALEQEPVVQGALVSIDPKTGNVKALCGGYDFFQSQFNRATQAKRQPGSAFKPIVYSVALDNGLTPASVLLDAPYVAMDFDKNSTWKPENFEGVFYGPTLLRTALVKSRNTVTIRVAEKVGIKKIINRAKALGLNADFPEDLSVALGSGAVTLVNLCQAYTAIARGGSTIEPVLIKEVKSAWGEDLFLADPVVTEVLSPQTAYIVSYLMKHVVQYGTGWRAKVLHRPIAGKTGTSNNENDAWFMGITPYLLTGVYVGFDQVKPMGKWETGSRAASPIFVNYRKQVEADYPYEDFQQPIGIVMTKVDGQTGLLAGPMSKESFFLPFKTGTEPKRTAAPGSSDTSTSGSSGASEDLFKQDF